MIILIPLGGIGERFKNNGYNIPKALIQVDNKPILFHLLGNLNLNETNKIIHSACIPYIKFFII